jgi:hypothetical protein
MSSVTPPGPPSNHLTIAIVGNDALIAALPARPIQFAHACQEAGFDLVLPESWGDELVAESVLRKLEDRRGNPAVLCACPFVRERLLASGVELAPLLINTVAPPIAVARYVRALFGNRVAHLAYVGDCPAASAPDYDAHHGTIDFLRYLRDRGVDLLSQPTVFDAILPPDRRRFISLPGGCPTPEALWLQSDRRALVGLHSAGAEFAIELAEQLLAREPVLIDVAPLFGCVCSGVTATTPDQNARVAVMSLEPPRAGGPVVDSEVVPSLDEPIRPRRGGGGGQGGAPPVNGGPEPNVPGRPPVAVTPPRALT